MERQPNQVNETYSENAGAMARIKDLEDRLTAIHWHAQRIADHE